MVREILDKEKDYATKQRIKSELATQPHGRFSKNYSFYSDITFEQKYLHLILFSYLTYIDLASLNQYY